MPVKHRGILDGAISDGHGIVAWRDIDERVIGSVEDNDGHDPARDLPIAAMPQAGTAPDVNHVARRKGVIRSDENHGRAGRAYDDG